MEGWTGGGEYKLPFLPPVHPSILYLDLMSAVVRNRRVEYAIALVRRAAWACSIAAGLMVGAGCAEPVRPSPGRIAARDTLERRFVLGARTLVLDGHAGQVEVAASDSSAVRLRFVRSARGATRSSAERRLASVVLHEVLSDSLAQFVWSSDLDGTSVRVEGRVPVGARVVIDLDAGRIRADGLDAARTTLIADTIEAAPLPLLAE